MEYLDVGINAGLDFGFKKFIIGIEAQYGMANIAKTAAGNLHNINYSLVFGYKL